MWAKGQQHGEGVYVNPKGEARTGEWENGKRIKWLDETT
jgi:hypothetical protein